MEKLFTVVGIIRTVGNCPTYLLEYAGALQPKERVYNLRNGIKIITRPKKGDRSTINEVFIHKLYPYEIQPSDIVVDIGAHVGVFTVFAAKKAYNGEVYSYEPEPTNFKQLKKNVVLNHLKNVKETRTGVAGRKGMRTFYVSNQHTGGNSIIKVPGKKIKAKFTTLKDIIDDNEIDVIDFLKVDVEGAEYEILLSTPKEYFNKIKRMGLEYHDWMTKKKGGDLKTFLEKLGFNVQDRKGMLYGYRS